MEFPKPRPKASNLGDTSKAIVAHLRTHGRCTFEQLDMLFKEPSRFRANHQNAHIPRPEWLRGRLSDLRKAGHVSRELHEGTPYFVVSDQVRDTAQGEKTTAVNVTPPRRVYVMGGETYSPAKAAPYRAGAMDFASHPSLRMGRTVPFDAAKEASHG